MQRKKKIKYAPCRIDRYYRTEVQDICDYIVSKQPRKHQHATGHMYLAG